MACSNLLYVIRWWAEYSDRKNDEEDEHVSDSLLYDRYALLEHTPDRCSVQLAAG